MTLRIVGIVHVYNEIDIIEQFLDHMARHSIPLIVLDNGSADGTYEVIKENKAGIIIRHAQLITGKFALMLLLRVLHAMAALEKPDWILHVDADELVETRFGGALQEAISREAEKGFNLIQFDNYEFWPTRADSDVPEIKERIRHYSWNDRYQFKAWKHGAGIRLHPSGGHLPVFPRKMKVRLSPTRFVLRHYSIRSYQQGRRKVFEERLGRYGKEDMEFFKMKKYNAYRDDPSYFVLDASKLNYYGENGKWNDERKFTGWRTGSFPDLHSSKEVRRAMNSIAEQYDKIYAD